MTKLIEENIKLGAPISRDDAKHLYTQETLAELGRLATLSKSRYHPLEQATYLKMAIINYTNICVAKCDFCAFYKLPHQSGGYLLSTEEVFTRIDKAVSLDANIISFNGGFHPKLHLEHYAGLFYQIHQRYPALTFYEMTVAEFMFSCKVSKISYEIGAKILKQAGTQWITGGGSEVLDDSFRMRHSPGKYKVADYYRAQEAILNSGMNSTATMVIGFDETLDERLNHLSLLREFQDKVNHQLPSFLCWSYKPYHTELGGKEISSEEYLRWLAICRIYLHNFKHIRTSVLTKNEKALIGLHYGADDFDLPLEDEVTEKAGATISHDFESILNYGKNLGFSTVHRQPFKGQNKEG